MNRYPDAETNLTQLFKIAFRLHYLTLKHTIFFILLIVAMKNIAMFFTIFVTNWLAQTVVYFMAGLLVVYLFSAALLATHESFMDRSKTFTDTLAEIKKNAVNIYATFFGYIAGILCTYALAKLLGVVIHHVLNKFSFPLHGFALIIMATMMMMFLAMFFYSYPLAVIDSKKIQNAFYDSLVLSDKNKLGILVLFFIMLAVDMLTSPTSLQEYFLSTYHLGILYDFVVLSVMLPLFINLLLLLIHDAKLQLMVEEG